MAKGDGWPCGENHWKTSVTWDDVELMRDLADEGLSTRQIATKFDLSYHTVYDIVQFKTWGSRERRLHPLRV